MKGAGAALPGKTGPAMAPAPMAPISLLGATVPPDTSATRAGATSAAVAAALRLRKKSQTAAAPPSLLTTPAKAILTPKSLLGRY